MSMDECCYSNKLPKLDIAALVKKIRVAENQLLEMVYDPSKNYELHEFPCETIYNHKSVDDYSFIEIKKLYDIDAKEYVCTLITESEKDKVTVKMIRPDVDSVTNLENSVTGV